MDRLGKLKLWCSLKRHNIRKVLEKTTGYDGVSLCARSSALLEVIEEIEKMEAYNDSSDKSRGGEE